jgi:uncharacterized protein (TIGR02757 family)
VKIIDSNSFLIVRFILPPLEMKDYLDEMSDRFNTRSFIDLDPISIPHQFSSKEDIEISGFLTASISWGNRKAILKGAKNLMELLDHQPFDFVMNHQAKDLKRLDSFVYRTFNGVDLKQFILSLRHVYKYHQGMESIFTAGMKDEINPQKTIHHFRNVFFERNKSARTTKHVADPMAGSTAKRINMFLRWMVRQDKHGVDFGLWKNISPSQLSLPLDVHTGNVARKLGLVTRSQNDWKTVVEIDQVLRSFNSSDPIKYDFALFGLGAIEGMK